MDRRLRSESCMSGDVHVQFYEGLRGKFPRATLRIIQCHTKREAIQIRKALEERFKEVGLEIHEDRLMG